MRFSGVFLLFVLFVPLMVSGQDEEANLMPLAPVHRNVIKYNPTPKMLWSSNNWTFSYERILNNKQSFTVGLGYLEFGKLFKDTIANVVRSVRSLRPLR